MLKFSALAEGEGLLAIFPMAVFISWIAIPAILLYGFPIAGTRNQIVVGEQKIRKRVEGVISHEK